MLMNASFLHVNDIHHNFSRVIIGGFDIYGWLQKYK